MEAQDVILYLELCDEGCFYLILISITGFLRTKNGIVNLRLFVALLMYGLQLFDLFVRYQKNAKTA
jgi:hypothetical protein